MNETEKYHVLLQELAELLQSKNDTIAFLRYHVGKLEEKLAEAESHKEEVEPFPIEKAAVEEAEA